MSKIKTKNKTQITKHNMGLYKLKETKTLTFPYGSVTLNEGALMVLPHSLPIDKTFNAPIETLYKNFDKNTNLNNKRILINRYGGIGDLLCMLPAIYELKVKYPTCQIGIMASYSYLPIFYNFPTLIEGCVNNVVMYNSIKHFDYFINFDKLIENYPDPNANIHDIYAENLYVKMNKNTIDNVVKINSITTNINDMMRNGIGIQYKSNAIIRDYPIENVISLINLIHLKRPNELIYLLGPPDDYINVNYIQSKTNGNVLVNGCGSSKMNINETFDLIGSLKAVIAPDSSMVHMAGMVNTPIIGLYGPFDSESRMKYYKNAIGIMLKTECSPCNRHQPLAWCKWTSGESLCLKQIEPDIIMSELSKIL